MSALSVNPPFPIFLDIDGQPLDAGYIYLGVANQATEANPIQAYWDAALTVAATQPIRTRGGFPVNAGVPARVYVNSDFSIVVKNRNGFQVFSSPTCTDRFNDAVVQVDSSDVTFLQAGTGAVTRTAQAKMRDTVSVKDFGAVGDGVTDDTAAIQAAIDYAGNWSSVAFAKTLYLPSGIYKTTATLLVRPYVNIVGDSMGKTTIKPTISSGPALSSDATTGVAEAYLQRFANFAIDGTNVTSTGYGWLFKQNKNSVIEQIRFLNFTGSANPVVSIEHACYGLSFNDCVWETNQAHLQVIDTNAASGLFPTTIYFTACRFDETTQNATNGIYVRNSSDIQFIRCIFQSMRSFYAIYMEGTSSAATGHDHIIRDCWFEDNGNGQVNSSAIYLKGVSGKPMNGVAVVNNRFHQSGANLPTYQMRLEWCDKTYINQNVEGFGGTFLKNSGNNTNTYIEEGAVSACELHYPVTAVAWGNFSGKGSVTVNDSFGVSGIVRNSAGSYTVTLSKTMNNSSYVVTANAEDGSLYTGLFCSPSGLTTTTFNLSVSRNDSTLVDGRTVFFTVFGVEA